MKLKVAVTLSILVALPAVWTSDARGQFEDRYHVDARPPEAPVLDPHPAVTAANEIVINGTAPLRSVVEVVGPAGLFLVPTGAEGDFTATVPLLPNRVNRVFFTSIVDLPRTRRSLGTSGARSAARLAAVTQDSRPPMVAIDFPAAGSTLVGSTTDVAGRVGDMLSGFLGLTVDVNGVPAEVDPGIGNNGTFLAPAVPLEIDGPTLLVATARDAVGNVATTQILVRRETPEGPRLESTSGNGQVADVHELLPDPIVVNVLEEDGTPFAGKTVTFEVVRSDGLLLPDAGAQGVRRLQRRTDASGRASVLWRLGTDAGCGNNRVRVKSNGVAGEVTFCATALPGVPTQINIGSGNQQQGEAGAVAPEPLRVFVLDGCNGVGAVPVDFTVVEGGGLVDGAASTTVFTSDTGHAQVSFTFGDSSGNHVVQADFTGNPGRPATFVLNAVRRDLTKPARFTGFIQSSAKEPIEAPCVLALGESEFLTTVSRPNGLFTFSNLQSAGSAHLEVKGRLAFGLNGESIPPGSFPDLSFETVIIPNAETSLAAPALLPPLDPQNEVLFDNTRNVLLTVEGLEGLRMLVSAGSMTRADGSAPSPSDPAVLSLNAVDHDDVPMPMPDGAAPIFAWTLQPAGAAFDPPIRIEYPNFSGLAPGAVSFFLNFDHDTNEFEIVATGTVSEDGSTIVSDPGSGLAKAGWGCNCPPYSVTEDCEENCDEFENECARAEREDELGTAAELIGNALERITAAVPNLDISDVGVSSNLFAETCPTCCNDMELFPGIISFGGSVTGTATVTGSLSPLNRSFMVRREILGCEIELDVDLEMGPVIELVPSLTLNGGGSHNLCTSENCFTLGGESTLDVELRLGMTARTQLGLCNGEQTEFEVTAVAKVNTDAMASVNWDKCASPPTSFDGCMGKLAGQATVTIELPIVGSFDVKSPQFVFYSGNCD